MDDETWEKWFATTPKTERIISDVRLPGQDGERIRVLTQFLDIDQFSRDESEGQPYETIVVGGPFNRETEQYATDAEAREGHDRMVAKVSALISDARNEQK